MSKYFYRPNLLTVVDDFFNDIRPLTNNVSRAIYTAPALNVTEHDDRYEIKLFIPDLDPQKIKIELVEKVLNISYEHEENEKEEESGKLLREEYRHYSFARSVSLPKNVDENSINAKSSKGTLTIIVKKLPETQPKKVDIHIED
jgi:HSP20 family protein